MPDPCLLTTPPGFSLAVAAPGCTKQLCKVQAAWPFTRAGRLPGVPPGALETHAFPTPALQNHRLAPRGAGPFVTSSTRGQPRGNVFVAGLLLVQSPSRAGGQSKPVRSGTLAHECIRDRRPKRSVARSTLHCARPWCASVRPLAPRHGRHGCVMVPACFAPLRAVLPLTARAATAPHGPDVDTGR